MRWNKNIRRVVTKFGGNPLSGSRQICEAVDSDAALLVTGLEARMSADVKFVASHVEWEESHS